MIAVIAALVFIGLLLAVATRSNRKARMGGYGSSADTVWSTPAYYASDGGAHDSGADGGADSGGGGDGGGSDGGGGCGGGGCGGGGGD